MKIKKSYLLTAALISLITGISSYPAYAASSSLACLHLTSRQSDDKNYYEFTATASISNPDTIQGYDFDFGDKQSYRFNFDGNPSMKKDMATVRHTYENNGNYIATVNVIGLNNNKEVRVSSPSCSTPILIGSPVISELPTTGPSAPPLLAILSLGLVTYKVVLGLRTPKIIPKEKG